MVPLTAVVFMIFLIIKIKFQLQLDTIKNKDTTIWVVWYTIKSKYNNFYYKEFFKLFTLKK